MIHSHSSAWALHQARLDQSKVTMGTLEKQLEEGKQRVQAAESQRGAGTGKHQSASGIFGLSLSAEAVVPTLLPGVTLCRTWSVPHTVFCQHAEEFEIYNLI